MVWRLLFCPILWKLLLVSHNWQISFQSIIFFRPENHLLHQSNNINFLMIVPKRYGICYNVFNFVPTKTRNKFLWYFRIALHLLWVMIWPYVDWQIEKSWRLNDMAVLVGHIGKWSSTLWYSQFYEMNKNFNSIRFIIFRALKASATNFARLPEIYECLSKITCTFYKLMCVVKKS